MFFLERIYSALSRILYYWFVYQRSLYEWWSWLQNIQETQSRFVSILSCDSVHLSSNVGAEITKYQNVTSPHLRSPDRLRSPWPNVHPCHCYYARTHRAPGHSVWGPCRTDEHHLQSITKLQILSKSQMIRVRSPWEKCSTRETQSSVTQ